MRLRTTPLLVGLALAVVLALAAATPTATKHHLHWQGALHPWLHVLGFATLGFLLFSSTRSTPLRILILCALLAFGYATEALESHRDGWPIEQNDVVHDSMGVLLGSLVSTLTLGRPKP